MVFLCETVEPLRKVALPLKCVLREMNRCVLSEFEVTHLDTELRVLLKVVEDLLVVGELRIPFTCLYVAEVVAEGHQQHR